MARPDLTTPEGRRAYNAELMAVGRPWRWIGLGLVVAATGVGLWNRWTGGSLLEPPLGLLSAVMMAAGWGIVAWVITLRTRLHRRRMAEPEA